MLGYFIIDRAKIRREASDGEEEYKEPFIAFIQDNSLYDRCQHI
jgi:hypothetical protein